MNSIFQRDSTRNTIRAISVIIMLLVIVSIFS
ncbi:MAG: hypothetical protein JWP27_1601 [Flaviaesturariibacter sp.]|nr:hypothetical protein [Flaviaesturariibacter sp.]